MNPVLVAVEAMKAAGRFGINPLKVLPGLFVDFGKIYMLASFGAATKKFEAATIEGDLGAGIQFVGQVQGLITDVPTVEELVQRVLGEARETHARNAGLFVDRR
jgi:enoyl-[acyl-carrier protein] reductase II